MDIWLKLDLSVVDINFHYRHNPHVLQAILNPGTLVKTPVKRENGYTYEGAVCYTAPFLTVYGMGHDIACPVRYSHHIGSTCTCCGLKG